ncbi:MAG: nicotinamide-nucleotide amidohydrolase family protein [Methylococcaceae bacterium]|jgi:nicotinamide-nucleotide amidase
MDAELIELAGGLGRKLAALGAKIAVAESCTGGLIAQGITEIAGCSAWFDRGFITYSNTAKIQMLDVKLNTLESYGAVSAEIAQEMALGAIIKSEVDFSLAVTGIAGPGGGSKEKPVGTVYVAWAQKGGDCVWRKLNLIGDRHSIRLQTAKIALQYYFLNDDLSL